MPASMSRWKHPAAIAGALRRHAPKARLIGLETGQLSNWLTRTLCEQGLPVVCLDARHAKAALKRVECPWAIKDKRGNFVTNLWF